MSAPLPIHAYRFVELRELARARLARGHGRARQVYQQVMYEGRFAPEELGLSDEAVREWRTHFALPFPEVVRTVEEEGPFGVTAKAVLRTHDGLELECVRIPMGRGRTTLCISSQVGCKMGCTFCETGRLGLVRHLTVDEIVAQVLVTKYVLGWPLRNIVFMGMGEALDNADAVLHALKVFNDPSGLAIGQERITVCTVGHVEGIRRIQREGFKRLNLSVSLNAADDATRSRMMPINRKTPLAELQAVLAAYRPRRNFTLGVNYCLMPGINDSREDAERILAFCAPIERVLVNVIPYNPGNEPLTRAPTDAEVDTFLGWLREGGLAVRRRLTKGRTVMAACGQLGNVEMREKRRELRARERTLPVVD